MKPTVEELDRILNSPAGQGESCPRIAVGDVVRLRSGGPPMTVESVNPNGRVECYFFESRPGESGIVVDDLAVGGGRFWGAVQSVAVNPDALEILTTRNPCPPTTAAQSPPPGAP